MDTRDEVVFEPIAVEPCLFDYANQIKDLFGFLKIPRVFLEELQEITEPNWVTPMYEVKTKMRWQENGF